MTHTLTDVSGVGPSMAETLIANKIDSVKKLARIDIGELTSIPGIGEVTGRSMVASAGELLATDEPPKEGKKGKKNGKRDNKDDKGKKGKKDRKGKKGKNKKGKKSKK